MKARRWTLLGLVWICLVLGNGWTPAYALDDGGGRSVFAIGAGNRALGLGGAYGAVADDGSASLWNPAGVGLLQRRQFAVTHTNLFGMGFSEQYLSIGYPHWRLGNFALTIRMFGVDGIEHRDDRNLLLADDLEDRETEIGLSYGRSLGAGLYGGTNLKLQRHSLAGYEAGGFGVDVGVLSFPGSMLKGDETPGRWSVGVSIRNLLEPAQRLDMETVPDPRAVRVGTAWRQDMGDDVDVLLAMDLEQTRGMAGRWHVGAEAEYRRTLALRTGSLAGAWTAGFGVRWKTLGVDYVYESNRLGDIQRIGLTVHQGDDVATTRAAVVRREEEERQRRLDEAFAAETTRRIEDLLEAARLAVGEGRYEQALDQLAMVSMLDEGNVEAEAMERRVLRDRAAGQERRQEYSAAIITLNRLQALAPDDSQTASDLRRVQGLSAQKADRSREIQVLYASGLDAFATGELLKARDTFTRAAELSPDDEDVQAMLARTNQALAQRAEALCAEARGLARAGLFTEATETCRRSERFGASPDSVAALTEFVNDLKKETDLAEALRRQERRREAELAELESRTHDSPPPAVIQDESPKLTPTRIQELESLKAKADSRYEAGEVDEAVRIWELIRTEAPEFGDVGSRLSQEYLSRGMEAFAAGRLDEAVGVWELALRADPEDQRARSYLERARQQAARIRRLQQD